MYFVPKPLSADTLVSAAVKVVLPWSTWPMVPTFTCGLVRSNFAFAICPLPGLVECSAGLWSPVTGLGGRRRPATGDQRPHYDFTFVMISSAFDFGTSS